MGRCTKDKNIECGKDPSVGFKILAVTNANDTMISRRPYRKTFSQEKTCSAYITF